MSAPATEVTPAAATRTVALLCTAAFMTMLDLFIVNVAFASIGESYPGASLAGLSWVLNAYIVVYAACLIPAGSLSDRYGRRRGFLVGLGLFTIASAGCALAPGLGFLIAARAAQAVGAAILTPAGLGLILSVLPEARRGGAVRIWATSSSFAGALGPVIGGLLAQTSWRWAFLLNLPVGVIAYVAARRLLPHSAPPSRTRIPDPLGSIAVAVAIGALSLGLVSAGDWGWTSPRMLLTATITVAATALLVHRVRTHPVPVMSPRLFRVPSFTAANVTILLFTSAFSAVFLSVALWLEIAAGYGPLRAGLALVPGPLAVPLFAALTHRWAATVPARFVVSAGLAVFGAGSLLLAARDGTRYATDVLPAWIVIGAGIGIAMPTLIGAATAGLAPAAAATGSAVVNTARQAGYALGVAALVAILGSAVTVPALQHGWLLVSALVLVSAATALGIRAGGSR
ncbi:MFS transporter [Actinoplanes utahensis]|uniref:Major facilitator transporter n=1 Tax=Actinoplanes utahensis TaxID=1869 RepID=A0A0A6XA22_ACTUT|nr:MFS transporter [Actinoplanes utahensis]KHD76962.1 major facilitator transporter [Actinoplanes utahensis]GIF27255.1 MFS transporter [Actinoplanes utahensis]